MNTKVRNYGIDLLRVVAMYMVVILHVLEQGGILESTQGNIVSDAVSWFMEIGAYCAVNCYALISGFVGFSAKKRYNYARYIELWLQVVFYCVMITLIVAICNPGTIGKGKILSGIMPVTFGYYWYFTAYTGVFLFMPIMNLLLQKMTYKDATKLVLGCIFVFSVYETFAFPFSGDVFKLLGGYSFLWLSILYLIGAYIKQYEVYKEISKKVLLIIGGIFFFFTWGLKILVDYIIGKPIAGIISGDLFISYVSPTILGISIILLILFAGIEVNDKIKNVVKFAAPATFGVYLLHVHPLVWSTLKGKFALIGEMSVWKIPIAVLSVAVIIFIIGILLDRLRGQFFRILHIRRFAEMIENKGKAFTYKI